MKQGTSGKELAYEFVSGKKQLPSKDITELKEAANSIIDYVDHTLNQGYVLDKNLIQPNSLKFASIRIKQAQNVNAIVSIINPILTSLQRAYSSKLALDIEFETQQKRLAAIVSDINNGKMPKHRYWELLYENWFDEYEEEKDENTVVKVRSSRTFLAFALPKLKDCKTIKYVLDTLKSELGAQQFNLYLNTPLFLAGKNDHITIEGLYLIPHEMLNEVEFRALDDEKKALLKSYIDASVKEQEEKVEKTPPVKVEARDIKNIDTHNISSERSAIESHIAAFKRMLEKEKLDAAVFLERKVDVNRDDNKFKDFIKAQLIGLRKEIEDVIKDCAQDPARAHILFQAEAAKRFMDDMIDRGVANTGGNFPYETNSITLFGLTMEEMVATCYWASKDQEKIDKNISPQDILLAIIRQLYDMRRGYNIDRKEDKPDQYQFPGNPRPDQNRCRGGCVNSLPTALSSIHPCYHMRYVQRADLEKDIKEFYDQEIKAICENETEVNRIAEDKAMLLLWNTRGEVTGDFGKELRKLFEQKHRAKFEGLYKGYIDDKILDDVIDKGLNNITMPKALNKRFLEDFPLDKIYQSILDGELPLLRLGEQGYQSTLNYFGSLPGNEDLIVHLFEKIFKERWGEYQEEDKKVLLHLSKSKVEPVELDETKGAISITQGDLSFLNLGSLSILFSSEGNFVNALHRGIASNQPGLLDFCYKHFHIEWFNTKINGKIVHTYIHNDVKISSDYVAFAAIHGMLDFVKGFLTNINSNSHITIDDLVNPYEDTKKSALYCAAFGGYVDIVAAILDAYVALKGPYTGYDILRSPLGAAIEAGQTSMVKFILEKYEQTADAKKELVAPSSLEKAIKAGHIDTVELVINKSGFPGNILNNYGNSEKNNMLHLAAKARNAKLFMAVLRKNYSLLSSKNSAEETPLDLADEKILESVALEFPFKGAERDYSKDPIAVNLATSVNFIKILIKNHPDKLNIKDKKGRTLLHIAAINDCKEVVEEILAIDPNTGTKDANNKIPYDLARQGGRCKQLLQRTYAQLQNEYLAKVRSDLIEAHAKLKRADIASKVMDQLIAVATEDKRIAEDNLEKANALKQEDVNELEIKCNEAQNKLDEAINNKKIADEAVETAKQKILEAQAVVKGADDMVKKQEEDKRRAALLAKEQDRIGEDPDPDPYDEMIDLERAFGVKPKPQPQPSIITGLLLTIASGVAAYYLSSKAIEYFGSSALEGFETGVGIGCSGVVMGGVVYGYFVRERKLDDVGRG